MIDTAKATSGEICRKTLDHPSRSTVKSARADFHTTACKSYVEMRDGTLVDEDDLDAVNDLAAVIKTVIEIVKIKFA